MNLKPEDKAPHTRDNFGKRLKTPTSDILSHLKTISLHEFYKLEILHHKYIFLRLFPIMHLVETLILIKQLSHHISSF